MSQTTVPAGGAYIGIPGQIYDNGVHDIVSGFNEETAQMPFGHGVRDGCLPPGWSDAPASFGSLPYPGFNGIQLCQETDALYTPPPPMRTPPLCSNRPHSRSYNHHVVEFKTLEAVHIDSGSGSEQRDQFHREKALCEHVRQMAVSQMIIFTRANNTPSSSATSWCWTVRNPWPKSHVPA